MNAVIIGLRTLESHTEKIDRIPMMRTIVRSMKMNWMEKLMKFSQVLIMSVAISPRWIIESLIDQSMRRKQKDSVGRVLKFWEKFIKKKSHCNELI